MGDQMSKLTEAGLMDIMRECAGEATDLTGDVGDTPFEMLGYDSLAVLETASRIERDYGLRLDEGEVTGAKTPRDFLALVNAAVD
jgi:act minimal PKS acyl carrier protein